MILAFLLAASAPSAICTKLRADFDRNEQAYAIFYGFAERDVASTTQFTTAVNTHANRVRLAEAQRHLADTQKKYLEAGDRITTLLLANKCPPPDHVTSPHTWAKNNPLMPPEYR